MLQLPIYTPSVNFNQSAPLDFLSSVLSFSPIIIWILAGLIIIFFLFISSTLYYHWKRFGIEKLAISKIAVLYFSISAFLVVTMAISLFIYIRSI